MDTDKNGLNTKTIRRFFPLSANGVGGEGRGEVAHKTQIPSPCPYSRLGGAREKASRISELYPCSSAQISERTVCAAPVAAAWRVRRRSNFSLSAGRQTRCGWSFRHSRAPFWVAALPRQVHPWLNSSDD
jgi:hypothetical protein